MRNSLNSTEEKTINKNNMSIAKSYKEDNEVDDSVIFNTALKEALNIISMKENKEENNLYSENFDYEEEIKKKLISQEKNLPVKVEKKDDENYKNFENSKIKALINVSIQKHKNK